MGVKRLEKKMFSKCRGETARPIKEKQIDGPADSTFLLFSNIFFAVSKDLILFVGVLSLSTFIFINVYMCSSAFFFLAEVSFTIKHFTPSKIK